MRKNVFKPIVSLSLASALSLGAFAAPFSNDFAKAETQNIKVQLLGLNDFHGQMDYSDKLDLDKDGVKETPIGGIAYTAAAIKQHQAENPNTLLVEAGDMVGGSPLVSSYFQDEPTIEILKEMGFSVGTLGNHEFDEGVTEMLRMVNGGNHPDGKSIPGVDYTGTGFPVVAANVVYKDTGKLMLDPYTIKEVGGEKIGFIGVVTQETPYMIVQKGNENLAFTDEAEAINKYTKELKEKGIKSIVVLAHNPTTNTTDNASFDASKIAEKVDDEVDVIFAAHNHVGVNKVVDNKLIVQAYSYGTAFSDVDLEIDPTTHDIVKKSADVVTVIQSKYTPDPKVQAIVDKYEEKVKPVKEQVVGESAVELSGKYAQKGPVGDNSLGNLIADGMKENMKADFALMNGGGIRASVNAGPITWGELFSVQPFGNTLAKVDVTGQDLEDILNAQIDPVKGLDVSVGGFKYTWSSQTNKVVDIFLPDGSKIDKKKTYSVVVNNYMYGNPTYRIAELGENMEVGPSDLEATVEYVKSLKQPISYKAEGRISEVTLSLPFKDVADNHWAHDYINDLYFKNIIKGTSDTMFSPDKELSRSQFASLLVRALNIKTDKTTDFKDTAKLSEQVQKEVAAAVSSGIVVGRTAKTFAPYAPITRAEMMTMLMRAYKVKNGSVPAPTKDVFKDTSTLKPEMKDAIEVAYELGYVDGFGDQFKPFNTAKRAESAKVLYMLLKK
ncbi:5'-nucleotidase C-terminal domain-containing protein [Priestia koreensis]|uniref:2,' 3'-cyclic nucleotide 2'-phosphodiesterase n=1 Tax=Priestia koreensis TaxID=284581 RepID=A0A0M0KR91_9BACI|nr:5'-nucleotidase C-terminal domain-containing protein [Priestia koreensis]KOO41117.1 2,' 3'-cyclic nucleotide 2'-phosphodiesterase [Priestia koreensis]